MADLTKHEKFWFNVLMKKGSDYVIKNWHKFSHQSKERIFLACMNKAIASKVEGDLGSRETNIIIIKSNGEKIESGDNAQTSARALPVK
jgi:hypothetical protein